MIRVMSGHAVCHGLRLGLGLGLGLGIVKLGMVGKDGK